MVADIDITSLGRFCRVGPPLAGTNSSAKSRSAPSDLKPNLIAIKRLTIATAAAANGQPLMELAAGSAKGVLAAVNSRSDVCLAAVQCELQIRAAKSGSVWALRAAPERKPPD